MGEPDSGEGVPKDATSKPIETASPPPTAGVDSGGLQGDINNLEAKVAEAQKFDLEAEMKRNGLIIETDKTDGEAKKAEAKTEKPLENQHSDNAVSENNSPSQNPSTENNPIQDKNAEQPKDKVDKVTEKAEEDQEIMMEAIESEPAYQEILLALTNNENNKNVDAGKLKQEAFREFVTMIKKDKIREAEIKEGVKFSPEQEKIYKKESQRGFEIDPLNMFKATKQAEKLRQATIYAETLSKEQNVTQEQISKASEAVNELQKKYDVTTEKIIAQLPKESPLISLLKDTPKDPRLLEIMKKEKTNGLIKLIGLLIAMASLQVVDEIKKAAIPSQEQ